MRIAFLSVLLALGSLAAQAPEPVVLQAVAPGSTAPRNPAPAPQVSATAGSKTVLQLVQEMQATNTATLKKQEAALLKLDELQKAAEDIKIYSKRG
jgi:hypothetical protein